MIADSSLSSAFDDLADLFLGGEPNGSAAGPHIANGVHEPVPAAADRAATPSRPFIVEALVLGHLPMMASLWAGQYPRMVAAQDDAPVALVRLDEGAARVELFHPPTHPSRSNRSRLNGHSDSRAALPDRPAPDLAGALSRAAQVAARVVIFSTCPGDELLLARASAVGAIAVLTGADDASAVGAYKAIKRLAGPEGAPDEAAQRTPQIRVAVMGSDERKAVAAFHRLADASSSFLSVPVQLAGHCRQIAGGMPGSILFEGPSAMTTQAVLECLSRPAPHGPQSTPAPLPFPKQPSPPTPPAAASLLPPVSTPKRDEPATSMEQPAPDLLRSVEAAALGLMTSTPSPSPATATTPDVPHRPTSTPPGLTPLSVRCPFDRNPVLAIDAEGVPQIIAAADAGHSADAIQRLLSVAAWVSASRELLGMVCPALRTDAQPVLHLITDRPTDVKRLIDSDLRLHVRIPTDAPPGTMALN
ncbi:MAG TPA: hypothetical protein VEB22_09555 [Phycisphaerales bacterium]|nr:hypothetical protein [Phycisphaerales bacterium]